MTLASAKTTKKAKPFLKWAGGKGQLLDQIDARLPEALRRGEIDTYVEPFVGGGAVFFHVAQKYEERITTSYLFDINEDLVACYKAVKKKPESVISELQELQSEFLTLDGSARRDFYYRMREEFNSDRSPAKLIFLNRTCYNGLYRVNRRNEFNVPFGDYKNPKICDADNLRDVASVLRKANIICADFEASESQLGEGSFVYFDPPYRPLSASANFTSYSKENFSEADQTRLATFCRRVDAKGAVFLLSNSDPKNEDPRDRFFEKQYHGFRIDRVRASRPINCKASGRGEINELIITNY